ncbi:hypothetical protein AVEN_142319-1 [Araneus ventricosus]|uniref:Uncharacterized protein n=1 Tax=Araneus ventricosus TaxID=182803 RepID=A0A4Y2KUR0_ARAVE|nr:hypothetical protein AVEN_142319-1 [Araneus ventricosus]
MLDSVLVKNGGSPFLKGAGTPEFVKKTIGRRKLSDRMRADADRVRGIQVRISLFVKQIRHGLIFLFVCSATLGIFSVFVLIQTNGTRFHGAYLCYTISPLCAAVDFEINPVVAREIRNEESCKKCLSREYNF